MGVIEKVGADVQEAPLLTRHRLSVHDYRRMGEAGVLEPDARVELIEGEVIDMAPIGGKHWAMVNRLMRLVNRAVGELAIVSVQSSLRLSEFSEPQPDIGLFKPRDDFYADGLPGPEDTLLLIEVADTSARYDREIKLPLYARHGVAEVWIVDLEARVLRFFRQPDGEGYADITASETPGLTPVEALPGVTIDLTRLFG